MQKKEAAKRLGRQLFVRNRDLILVVVAVALMLGGAVMLFTNISEGIAFPLIAIGIAISIVVRADKLRQHGTAH
jgi:hypothetical protein